MTITRGNIPSLLRPGKRTRRAEGGTTADKVALGASAAVRPGISPEEQSIKGATLGVKRMSRGGSLDSGYPQNDTMKLQKLAEKRNNELASPHSYYKKGGHTHHQARKVLHSLYKSLHHHFGGGSEPEKASGGKLWIKDAINPKNKGALHKSLHVPKGQKIPLSKLHQAEHSKSPKLRKRAQLAETLRGLNHRPRGR